MNLRLSSHHGGLGILRRYVGRSLITADEPRGALPFLIRLPASMSLSRIAASCDDLSFGSMSLQADKASRRTCLRTMKSRRATPRGLRRASSLNLALAYA